MNPKSTDDKWLDVLAGRAQAEDLATRQAAKARDFYSRQAEADQAQPVDEQRLKRLQNLMQAQVAERRAAAAAAKPVVRAGLLARLGAWFNPPQGGGLRYAGAAMAVMGLAAVLVIALDAPNDDHTMKGGPLDGLTLPGNAGGADWQVVVGGQPLARALAVQAALQQRNVSAEVTPLGDKTRLEASVPAAQQAAVRADLAALDITWAGSSALSLEFRAAR